jgi:hypothetical protein
MPVDAVRLIDMGGMMGTRTWAAASLATAGLLLIPLAAVSPAAADATCAQTVTWNGTVDNAWSTPGNWNPSGPPQPTDAVVVTPDPTVATQITGMAGTVCSLTVLGGNGAATRLALTGQVATAALHLGGFLGYATADTTAAPAQITVSGDAVLDPATDLALADDHANLRVGGALTIGDAVTIRSLQSGSAYPHMYVDGTLRLNPSTSNATGVTAAGVDVDVAASGIIDTRSTTLTITGPSFSQWTAGAAITDSGAGGGAVSIGNSAIVRIDNLTVNSPAMLSLTGSAILDGGSAGILRGTGTLQWLSGSVQGTLTLQQAKTWLTGGGSRFVRASPPSKLVNQSQFAMDDNGYLRADGDVENDATMVFRPGGSIMKLGSSSSVFRNAPGALLQVEGPGASTPAFPSDQVLVYGVTLRNEGTVDIPANERLYLVGAAGSQLVDGDVVSGNGSVQVGNGSSVSLLGTTTLATGASFLLDDQDDGTKALLVGGDATHPTGRLLGTLTDKGSTQASFRWNSGTILGNVAVTNLATFVLAPGSSSRRTLGDGNTPTTLTLTGPVLVSSTTVSMHPKSTLHLAGDTALSGGNVGFDAAGDQEDQTVVVDATGSLSAVADSASGSTPQPSSVVVEPPLTNHGTVAVDNSTLTAVHGYTQQAQPGAAASATLWTGVSNGGTFQSGASGALQPVTITDGGIGGVGTLAASAVSVDAGWVHPGYSSAPGTLTVNAPLTLSSKSDTRLVIWPPAPGTTTARCDVLNLTAPATLAGRLTTFTQPDASKWKPAYLTVLNGAVTTTSRTGGFGTVAWGGTPIGLGWRPLYSSNRVDLKLVDVAPPTPTRITVSAFTENPTGTVGYAATDLYAPAATGVASYDVRWRAGTPTTRFGAWHYPATWQHTTKTTKSISGIKPGSTYCYSIRARDHAGNQSAWTLPVCSARMYDDSAIAASSGWTRRTNAQGLYNGTYSLTSSYGATLSRRGTFRRVAVAAYQCPTCGVLYIYSGTHLLKKWSLKSSRTGMTSWISKLLTSRRATVRIKNVTSGRMVLIDAVGLAR